MVKFKLPHGNLPVQPGVSKGEKIKLILMTIGVVAVAGGILYSVSFSRKERSQVSGDVPQIEDEIPRERAYTPHIDVERIASMVADAEPADRVMLEGEALDELLKYARQMTAGSYKVLGAPELDATLIGAMSAAPDSFRAKPFFVRGWIDSIRTRRRGPASEPQYIGRLILEDESVAYFAALRMPENRSIGSFVRLDGLFLKLYSEEANGSGTWPEGPLLVGASLSVSWPAEGEVRLLDANKLVYLTDDSLDDISRLPFEATWHVMGYARDLEPGDVDWDEAPLLTKALLEDVMEFGSDHRLQPFRIPVSRLQSVTVKRADENPARLERFTEGWIGNATWGNLIYYRGPFEFRAAGIADLIMAKGFFLKNLAYEPRDGGIRLAPAFVLSEMQIFVPRDDSVFDYLVYGIAAATIGLLILFSLLLSRDRRSALVLQERLVQRRRARRGATA